MDRRSSFMLFGDERRITERYGNTRLTAEEKRGVEEVASEIIVSANQALLPSFPASLLADQR